MKEILFRGKRLDDGTWVEGYIFITRKGEYNIKWYDSHFGSSKTSEVDPKTVCQYTGVNDRTGRKIFEHDIISVQYEGDWWKRPSVWYEKYEVYFSDNLHAYRARDVKGNDYPLYEFDKYCTVIGNTIDNPKLMEE